MGIETTKPDTNITLYGTQPTRYMGIETMINHVHKQLTNRHNLLAIWVLKQNISTNTIANTTTQPTRYMGIETTILHGAF